MKRFNIQQKVIVFTAALSLAGLITVARADTNTEVIGAPPAPGSQGGYSGGMGEGHGACKADVDKFCGGVQPGHGALKDCLKQHKTELSSGCQEKIAHVKERMEEKKQELLKACQADKDKFCKDVTPGEGREIACLHAYNDKISQGCKQAMMSMKHHRKTPPAK